MTHATSRSGSVVAAATQIVVLSMLSATISRRTPSDEHWFSTLAKIPSIRSKDAEKIHVPTARRGRVVEKCNAINADSILAYPSKLGMYKATGSDILVLGTSFCRRCCVSRHRWEPSESSINHHVSSQSDGEISGTFSGGKRGGRANLKDC